jgi:DNA phosphorothioation-dependent restriction protein DptH
VIQFFDHESAEAGMRGAFVDQGELFSYIAPEARVPSKELKAAHWKFLMGAVGSQSMYIRQVSLIMKKLRDELTLAGLRKGIEDSGLSDHLKELALLRLRFAEEYVNDQQDLTSVLRPGRLLIVDLRDELVEKDEALGLFVVLLQMFAEATHDGRQFNKLVVFDEAHKYINSPDLVAGLVEVVREMRHKGTSILVASQDPPSVPTSLIELSSQIILHKFNSPSWLKHIQKANAALEGLTPAKLAALGPGEAYVWSSKATDDAFTHDAVKVRCRPRVTQHGGTTKTAVSGKGHP